MTLNEKIERAMKLKKEIEKLNEELTPLTNEIKEEMNKIGEKKVVTENNIEASITDKVNIKYIDELAIINYLKNKKMNTYLKESINTTNFNKAIKASISLKDDLKDYIEETYSQSFSIKSI